MKALKFYHALMAVAAIMLSLSFVACDDDDDDEEEIVLTAAESIEGSYVGSMAMTVTTIDCGTVDMTAVIAAESDESVSVTLDAFDISVSTMHMDMSIGEIAISGVTVTDNGDGTYALASESFTVENVAYDETTITVTGSLTGTIDASGNASITAPLTFGAMPMPVSCVFTGSLTK